VQRREVEAEPSRASLLGQPPTERAVVSIDARQPWEGGPTQRATPLVRERLGLVQDIRRAHDPGEVPNSLRPEGRAWRPLERDDHTSQYGARLDLQRLASEEAPPKRLRPLATSPTICCPITEPRAERNSAFANHSFALAYNQRRQFNVGGTLPP
jgi:hypothetical protein